MIFIGKNKEFREKNIIGFYTYALFSFFFVLFSFNSFSQDSIPIAKDLTEEKVNLTILKVSKAKKYILNEKIRKTIFIKNKIINYII